MHNNGNVLNVTELYVLLTVVKMINFVMFFFLQLCKINPLNKRSGRRMAVSKSLKRYN